MINRRRALRLVKPKAKTIELKQYSLPEIESPMLKSVLTTYLNTESSMARFQNYFVDGNTLYFRTTDNSLHIPKLIEHVIATKISHKGMQLIVGNSSVLPYLERKGQRLNNKQTEVQRILSALIPMLPFSVFEQAKLDVQKLVIVEQAKDETVQLSTRNPKYKEKFNSDTGEMEPVNDEPETLLVPRHFTGASLFRIGSEFYLFDVDRREIEHGIFNPFLVNLPKAAKTIAEAYNSLKPQAVKDAEKKGLEVLRQGEFFFIPVDAKTNAGIEALLSAGVHRGELDSLTLSAGPNRPNYAHGIEVKDGARLKRSDLEWNAHRSVKADAVFVIGEVTHSGREHAPLELNGWYTAHANTAMKSFTITGDVD